MKKTRNEKQKNATVTNREVETLLISKGMSNKLITREISIVEITVKVHVKTC